MQDVWKHTTTVRGIGTLRRLLQHLGLLACARSLRLLVAMIGGMRFAAPKAEGITHQQLQLVGSSQAHAAAREALLPCLGVLVSMRHCIYRLFHIIV